MFRGRPIGFGLDRRSANGFIAGTIRSGPMPIPFLACMAAAAHFYQLPPRVLPSLQAVEGGAVGRTHINADGSVDLGVMQVNSRWVEPLARYAGMRPADVRSRLLDDACFNIAAAAAIMRTCLIEARGDLMLAVGNYHSHTPALNQTYQDAVLGSAWRLFGPRAVVARAPAGR